MAVTKWENVSWAKQESLLCISLKWKRIVRTEKRILGKSFNFFLKPWLLKKTTKKTTEKMSGFFLNMRIRMDFLSSHPNNKKIQRLECSCAFFWRPFTSSSESGLGIHSNLINLTPWGKSFIHLKGRMIYCWWLKSCTTWDVWNLINKLPINWCRISTINNRTVLKAEFKSWNHKQPVTLVNWNQKGKTLVHVSNGWQSKMGPWNELIYTRVKLSLSY